jgi:putative transposase
MVEHDPHQVLQAPIKYLDCDYDNFFAKRAKFPKFKSRHKHMRFAYPQNVRVAGNHVWLPKIGWARFRKSREVEGEIKSATITQQASGWHMSILCDVEIPDYGYVPLRESNTIGIDLGLTSFVVSLAGHEIAAACFFRKAQKQLAQAQRVLSRKHKVARLPERVASQRHDFLHKRSTALVSENQAIMAEDLSVKGLARTRFAKRVQDAGWGLCLQMVASKTA